MVVNFYGTVSKLRESTNSSDLIDVHIITPGWGSSGYYSETLLRKAVADKVYHSGMHMNWDHQTEREEMERPERSLSKLAGALARDAWYDPNGWDGPGIYSTAKPMPPYAESINAMGPHIGVSHNIYGDSEWGKAEGREGRIITEIYADDFNTVDFVTLPGAGGHYRTIFTEALNQSNNPAGTKDREEAHLNTHHGDSGEEFSESLTKGGENKVVTIKEVEADEKLMEALKAKILKESDNEKLAESLKDALKTNKELKESLDKATSELVIQKGRTYALAKVGESKLPGPSQARIVESLAFGEIPVKDCNVDTVEFDKKIEEAIKTESEYIDSILKESGSVGVHDLGKTKESESSEDAKEAYKESLVNAGFTESEAKAMAGLKV